MSMVVVPSLDLLILSHLFMTTIDRTYERMRVNVAILSCSQAALFVANSILISTAALIGVALAPEPVYATVPIAMLFLFGMGGAMPASLLMKKIGRRAGFQIGLLFHILGALLSGYAIVVHSFMLFGFGIALLGVGNAIGAFYRFAAADVANESYRSRAISYVLAGSVVAAFIGPNLANLTKTSVSDALFAGSYWALAIVYGISLILISFLKVPTIDVQAEKKKGRKLREIARQPQFILAVVAATIGYGVMNLLMTSTPLAMEASGLSFTLTSQVIQWHIFAMFAPSFFTGHLIKKYGEFNIILAGLLALLGSALFTFAFGLTFFSFVTTLVLLGIGWNFTFLGGTTLLTTTYTHSEKAIVQGFNDVFVFSIVTLTALMSGVLHHLWGWFVLAAVTVIPIVVVTVFTFWTRKRIAPVEVEVAPS